MDLFSYVTIKIKKYLPLNKVNLTNNLDKEIEALNASIFLFLLVKNNKKVHGISCIKSVKLFNAFTHSFTNNF